MISGEIQSDEKYFYINLKEQILIICQGFQKKALTSALYNGISHHKICVVSSIDEEDNLLLKITGLGRCTTEMLENSLGKKIKNAKSITFDSASEYQKFCANHNLKLNALPPGFHSNELINVTEINEVHS